MMIEACGIEKWYFRGSGGSNRFFAVKKTDLVLRPGTMTVLTGRSGSGKTTLMNIMAGLLKPDSGEIKVDGESLYSLDDGSLSEVRSRHFGMIPQGADVFPVLTSMENILLPQGICRPKNGLGKDRLYASEEYAYKLMEAAGIRSLASASAGELSGGERRRICVVRALAGKPEFIFADEPTADLDDENLWIVLKMLRHAADEGASVFVVTHDLESLQFADTKFRMDDGFLFRKGA